MGMKSVVAVSAAAMALSFAPEAHAAGFYVADHGVRPLGRAGAFVADATREVIRQALLAHVYSVLPKPVNKSLLLHTLARALKTVSGSKSRVSNKKPDADGTPET